MKPEEARTRLQRQVDEAKARKQLTKQQAVCAHEWETSEESLPIDNLKFKKSNAYFIKKTCKVCQRTMLVDYVME